MATDFLETEQPVKDADVYFMRAVLHNWPDEYCVRILRNLLPGGTIRHETDMLG